MKRHLTLLSAVALAALGLVLVGQGLWIKGKAVVAQVLLERAFRQALATGQPVKPWAWADTWPVARLEVGRLGVSEIVLESGSGQALAFGPGHVAGTPDAGERGTAVYAAHRDTHFAFLGQLTPGDEITVTRANGLRFAYRVTATEVVRFDRSGIDAHAPGFHLALASCWPLDGTLHGPLRYVVTARLEDGLTIRQ
jgi:sortase A